MKKLLSLLALCLSIFFCNAQSTTITLGTGTSDSTYFGPIFRPSATNGLTESRHAYVYRQIELSTLGMTSGAHIVSIAFNKSTNTILTGNSTTYASFDVYMKNTSNTVVTTNTAWGTLMTGATLVSTTVYNTSSNNLGSGWITYPTNTPFIYTGGALEVYVAWKIYPGTATPSVYSTGSIEWLYSTYSSNVTLGAVPTNLGMDNSTILQTPGYGGTRRPNTQITFNQPPVVCTGTPNPGNTIASATSVCPGTPVVMSLQNTTNTVGITYQWYDQNGPIPGATSATYYFNVFINSTYYCSVTCAGTTVNSNPVTITIDNFLNCYCVSKVNSFAKEDIDSIAIGSWHHYSGGCAVSAGLDSNAYNNFTQSVAPIVLNKNTSYPVTLSIIYCYNSGQPDNINNSAIWIDYDHDGIFENYEKLYTTYDVSNNQIYYTGPHIETGTLIIPNNALYGITRGRFICQNKSGQSPIIPLFDPCLPIGLGETEDYLVDIRPIATTINLKTFIEGYYSGSGMMQSVLSNQGLPNPTTDCDSITVELHSKTAPYGLLYSQKVILNQNGTSSVTFSGLSDSFYVVIKHRNSIETWSTNPVAMADVVNYDFTTGANKAYGNNQTEVEPGIWAMYSGDINQDASIDAFDYLALDPDIIIGNSGYIGTDITGDGIADAFDYLILDPNIQNGIGASTP